MSVMETCTKNLFILRKVTGKTQKEIGEFLEISQSMYSKYERGARDFPLPHVAALCQYYGVSMDTVIGRRKPAMGSTK